MTEQWEITLRVGPTCEECPRQEYEIDELEAELADMGSNLTFDRGCDIMRSHWYGRESGYTRHTGTPVGPQPGDRPAECEARLGEAQ
jgi:hypothetical protein